MRAWEQGGLKGDNRENFERWTEGEFDFRELSAVRQMGLLSDTKDLVFGTAQKLDFSHPSPLTNHLSRCSFGQASSFIAG